MLSFYPFLSGATTFSTQQSYTIIYVQVYAKGPADRRGCCCYCNALVRTILDISSERKSNRMFGWRATGAERSQPTFWGRLRPFSYLVGNVGLEWLRPLFCLVEGMRLEWMGDFTPLVGPTCHRVCIF
jgi:hypothetical protein